MQNERAIAFINEQRKKGRTDQEIRGMLISRNWPPGIINQLLTTEQPPAYIPTPPQNLTPSSSEISTTSETTTDQKSKKIHSISILFFIITTLFTLYSINIFAVLVILHTVMENTMSFAFIKHYPALSVSGVITSLMSFILFYTAFKVREGSRFSFWLALSTILIFPTTLTLYVMLIAQPLYKQIVNAALKADSGMAPNHASLPIDYTSALLLYIPTLILLLISYKQFHFDTEAISKRAKIWLSIFFAIIVIPITGVTLFNMVKPEDTDFGYRKAQSTVSYHIYKPESYQDLTPTIKFEQSILAGHKDAIQIGYDVSFPQLIKGSPSRLIIVKEVGVDAQFNLDSFAKTAVKNPTAVQQIDFPAAKNHRAYLIEKKLTTSTFDYFSYITADNVLIYLISPTFSPDDLMRFASMLH